MMPTFAAVLFTCLSGLAPTSQSAPATALDTAPPHAAAEGRAPLVDAPLDESRRALLDMAFGAASAMPTFPHVKTRSRLQQDVLVAALELDQPQRALAGSAQIDNWRRGLVLAELACWAAEHQVGAIDEYLAGAEAVAASVDASLTTGDRDAEQVRVERPQSWQRDRILVRVLQARLLRGDDVRQRTLPADADPAEVAQLGSKAHASRDVDLAAELEYVDRVVAAGVFDVLRATLNRCVELYGRVYADAEQRAALDAKIRASWNKLPIDVRIDLLLDMADVALAHADPTTASGLVNSAQTIRLGATWLPEQEIPVMARCALLRARADERERGRALADDAWHEYEIQREAIVDIARAGALRPLAEAYLALGDLPRARELYVRVLEEGTVNPNARPRCEDLVATCLSMARHAFEPDEATWTRLRTVRAALRDPW